MYEFLKLTTPYAVDPDSRLFALLGTRHHELLEVSAKQLNLPSEIPLTTEDRDIFDLLELGEDGQWTLSDYKTWGSYKVAKAMGLIQTGKKPDPSGEVYKRSGAWGQAGSPKMVPVFQSMEQEVDNFEAELQLNNYRIKVMEKFGITITTLRIQATVRDGNTINADNRGVIHAGYMIPVKILPDEQVRQYFTRKRNDLLQALKQGKWSEPCNEQECWSGARCREYCEVWSTCSKGLLLHKENNQ